MELNLKKIITTHEQNDKYDYYCNESVYDKTHEFQKSCDIKQSFPHYEFFDQLLNHNRRNNFIFAGGSVFNTLVNYNIPTIKNSDYDIFFYNTSNDDFIRTARLFVDLLLINCHCDIIYETKFYQEKDNSLYADFHIIDITIKNGPKYQFINKVELKTPMDILNTFNIDYVKIYYDFATEKIYCAKEAYECYVNWTCPFSSRDELNIKAMNKGMRLYKPKQEYDNSQHHDSVIGLGRNMGWTKNLCWIGTDKLSDELLEYYDENFDKVWNLHPESKSTIVMREHDIDAHRYLQSYMNTPNINTVNITKSSYMFSKNNQMDLPEEFMKILKYVNNKFHYNYNQVVVNWYENGDDYLPYHKDWTNNLDKDFNVTTVTLYEYGTAKKPMKDSNGFTNKRTFVVKNDNETQQFRLENGQVLTLGGMTNMFYKHGIPKENCDYKRVSITMRYFEEPKDECVDEYEPCDISDVEQNDNSECGSECTSDTDTECTSDTDTECTNDGFEHSNNNIESVSDSDSECSSDDVTTQYSREYHHIITVLQITNLFMLVMFVFTVYNIVASKCHNVYFNIE